MERLTGIISYCSFTYCDNEGKCKIENVCYDKQLYEKLKNFEDLEEQGRLIKLPCKVGTEVYCIIENRCMHYLSKDCWNCSGQEFSNACYEPDKTIRKYVFVIEMLDEFGKTVFLTKEEAEKALAEMGE